MAGLWSFVNGPLSEDTLPAVDFCDVLWAVRLGPSNGGINASQGLSLLNAQLDQVSTGLTLDAHAQQDLLDMDNYIAGGTGESGQVARWTRICQVLSAWERNITNRTEQQSRDQTGVTFTF